MTTEAIHEHELFSVSGGRMTVVCDRGHEHEVWDHPGFEVCRCGYSPNEHIHPCDDPPSALASLRERVAAIGAPVIVPDVAHPPLAFALGWEGAIRRVLAEIDKALAE